MSLFTNRERGEIMNTRLLVVGSSPKVGLALYYRTQQAQFSGSVC